MASMGIRPARSKDEEKAIAAAPVASKYLPSEQKKTAATTARAEAAITKRSRWEPGARLIAYKKADLLIAQDPASSMASTILCAACPSHSSGTPPRLAGLSSAAKASLSIREGSLPTSLLVPSDTVTGRSVFDLSVRH